MDLNFNYLTGGTDTSGSGECIDTLGCHGTSVAGVISALENNGLGGKGVAPLSNIVSYNVLQALTSINYQNALVRNKDQVDISNLSWGYLDSGILIPGEFSILAGIEEGLATGRGGLGIVYVKAAGNGALNGDNANYDGICNFFGVICVAAVANNGIKSEYSERGATLWISTFSSGNNTGITTTDFMGAKGYNKGNLEKIENFNDYETNSNYTKKFGGTSSAAPLVSGVVALMLNANPTLTWRDVKLILAKSAIMIDPENSDWEINGGNFYVNHDYGFGSMDASTAVDLALTWTNISKMETFVTPLQTVNKNFDNSNQSWITDTISISPSAFLKINKIEHAAIMITINHPNAANLDISLTSPFGTNSILAESHEGNDSYFENGDVSFTFGSCRYLDENPVGDWMISVRDSSSSGSQSGLLASWQLKFYGREEQ